MAERNWEPLDDAAFDAALRESLPEPPPEDIVRETTPWRLAMDRVLTGLALCSVTLQFLCLDTLLTAVGLILLLLGFRALRRENGWLRGCYIVSLAKALYFFPLLLLDATIYRYPAALEPYLTAGSLGLTLLQFVCLWQGLRAVKAKAGLPAEAGAAGALIAWYLAAAALALWGVGGLVAGGLMLLFYVLIIRGLYRLSQELDEAGYVIRAAPVRISDRALTRALAGILTAGLLCGYLFGGGYKMVWTPVAAAETGETAEIRARLLSLGFPAEVLDDLAQEDLLACRDALQVVVSVTDQPLNDGREVVEQEGNTTYHSTVYDVRELRLTGVAVELPGQRETWRIFHHFRWLTDPGFRGTESLQLWPAWQSEGWDGDGGVTGRVLYTGDGTDFFAPYAFLDSETYTADSPLWGTRTATDLFAEFSLPRNGENKRGYVSYTARAHYADLQYIINSWLNYTHQIRLLQYPVDTAAEYRRSGAWGGMDAFRTVQSALQFYNTDQGIDKIDPN